MPAHDPRDPVAVGVELRDIAGRDWCRSRPVGECVRPLEERIVAAVDRIVGDEKVDERDIDLAEITQGPVGDVDQQGAGAVGREEVVDALVGDPEEDGSRRIVRALAVNGHRSS